MNWWFAPVPLSSRLKEHVQDPNNNPILIFPEGLRRGGGGEKWEWWEGGRWAELR